LLKINDENIKPNDFRIKKTKINCNFAPLKNAAQLSENLQNKLFPGLSNQAGKVQVGEHQYPMSVMELNHPTGKYVNKILIAIFNAFSRKGVIQTVGNASAPGLIFPELVSNIGINQFDSAQNKCPIISVNILGSEQFPDSVTVQAEPFMVLQLNPLWSNTKEYLSEMSSKYRVRAQKVLTVSSELTKTKLSDLPSNEWIAPCSALLYQSLQDKTIAIGKNLADLLHCYSKSLGPDFHVFGYYHEGSLVGFISCITDENNLFAMHLGMKKGVNEDLKLYQRMLFDLVEFGIDNQANSINFGRTGTEIKSCLGAKPVENSFVVFTRSRFLLSLFRIYLKYFRNSKSYTVREPFKSKSKELA
jgi:hypothetical protein